MRALAPVAAFITAFLIAGFVIWLMGRSPIAAFDVYVLQPLSDPWSLQELVVKATPLALIAIGLSYCFRANLWNIGAEGQYVIGAVLGSWLALKTHGTEAGFWVLPLMLLARHHRRRALRAHPGLPEDPLRRQRDPDQPDAGLCRAARPRLSGARALARSEGLQLPAIRDLRSLRDAARRSSRAGAFILAPCSRSSPFWRRP